MKRFFYVILIIGLTINIYAQTPQRISYQTVIRNTSGALVINHAVGTRISILQGSATGTVVFSETYSPVPQTNANGLITIEVGSGTPVTGTFTGINWASGPYFLKTETDPTGGTNYTITGTSQIISVPYALYSKTSEAIADNSVTSPKIVNGSIAGEDLAGNSVTSPKIPDGSIITSDLADYIVSTSKLGNLAVSPEKIQNGAVTSTKIADGAVTSTKITDGAVTKAKLSAIGGTTGQVLKLSSGNLTWGNDISGGLTLPYSGTGSTTGSTDLFYVNNSGTGRAIHAVAGSNTAVWGQTSGGYAGVDGRNTSGYGVTGHSQSSYGVYGRSDSSYGVHGYSNLSHGVSGISEKSVGGDFESKYIYGTAVYAIATSASGNTMGGQFRSISPTGKGIYAEASATSGSNFGIMARTLSSEGYAGWFDGSVVISGTLYKPGGSFEIDHPLDPANKILRHSFVESPDMMNIYNGNVITDSNGNAVVILPDYFEALNMDFRYQLTVIGEFAQAIITAKINNNRFTIRTDKPNVEVSWQVTGVRKDPWAKENRIVVEEYKKPETRSYFLHPKSYGLPDTRSILWGKNPEMMKQIQEQRDHRISGQ